MNAWATKNDREVLGHLEYFLALSRPDQSGNATVSYGFLQRVCEVLQSHLDRDPLKDND